MNRQDDKVASANQFSKQEGRVGQCTVNYLHLGKEGDSHSTNTGIQ